MTTLELKYNKTILKTMSLYLFDYYYILYILDDNEYFNIHIVTNKYQDTELNTLYLQEPKTDINISQMDDIYMTKLLLEFALSDKFYGYENKLHTFSITSESEELI